MADISKIKIGNTEYYIKDEVARSAVSGSITFIGITSGHYLGESSGNTRPLTDGLDFSGEEKLAPYSRGSLIRDNSSRLGSLQNGDVVIQKISDSSEYDGKEFIFIQQSGAIAGIGTWYEITRNIPSFTMDETDTECLVIEI